MNSRDNTNPMRSRSRPNGAITLPKPKLGRKEEHGHDRDRAEPPQEERLRSARTPAASKKTPPKTSSTLLIAEVMRYSVHEMP
jgi:hypothetical protein